MYDSNVNIPFHSIQYHIISTSLFYIIIQYVEGKIDTKACTKLQTDQILSWHPIQYTTHLILFIFCMYQNNTFMRTGRYVRFVVLVLNYGAVVFIVLKQRG